MRAVNVTIAAKAAGDVTAPGGAGELSECTDNSIGCSNDKRCSYEGQVDALERCLRGFKQLVPTESHVHLGDLSPEAF